MSLKSEIKTLASKLLEFQQSEIKFVWLLVSTFLLILVNPLLPNQGWGIFVFHGLMAFVVLAGILAARDERQIIRQIIFLGLFVTTLDWIQTLAQSEYPGLKLVIYALYAIFVALITLAMILEVIKSPKVTANIICGSVAGYLLIGLSGAFMALFIENLSPGSFLYYREILSRDGLHSILIYFSLISLSTVGYGDIAPYSAMARSLSLATGLVGQIYLTVLVAILVGNFLNQNHS